MRTGDQGPVGGTRSGGGSDARARRGGARILRLARVACVGSALLVLAPGAVLAAADPPAARAAPARPAGEAIATATPRAFRKPLASESIPASATLPAKYPDHWMLVHDFNFNSLVDGRVAIVDLTAPNANLKGTFSAAQFGNVLASSVRPELYSAETFYSRLSRGERTDVITIWDTASLKPTGEIVLPGGKRGQFVTFKNTFQFTNGERWALVYDFTPGASVTVVDLVARKVLGDVDMPGCSQMYPTGARGFSTLCADGTMTTIRLDETGKVASTATSARVNDIDHDPFFMMPAYVGRTAWFVSFRGTVHGFDFAGDEVRDLGSFGLGTAPGAKPEWRPGGWQVASADKAGRVYVLMNPNGREGSHKDGGSAVWVVDPAKRAVVQRIALLAPAVSIEATQQPSPLLVAARADGVLDVYDAVSGRRVRSLGGSLVFNPMTMTALP